MKEIDEIIRLSHLYGSDARFVLLGGGNTSVKLGDTMWVKASGTALGNIKEDGFVKMSLAKLAEIWVKKYPEDADAREDAVLADMMASRLEGETKRPSVEALLHSFLPFEYVVHLHPGMVNGMTCGEDGETQAASLFPDVLWIPIVNPGYILAKIVRDAMGEFEKKKGFVPKVIFLQNHGVFVGADTPEEIESIYDSLMGTLKGRLVREPNFKEVPINEKRVQQIASGVESFTGEPASFMYNAELRNRLADKAAFYPLSSAYTPDHIVYSGFEPMWIGEEIFKSKDVPGAVKKAMEDYRAKEGVAPKVICVEKTGAFAVSEKALLLFTDTIKVAVFSESFGGPLFMTKDKIDFIRNWEVEKYRAAQQK